MDISIIIFLYQNNYLEVVYVTFFWTYVVENGDMIVVGNTIPDLCTEYGKQIIFWVFSSQVLILR